MRNNVKKGLTYLKSSTTHKAFHSSAQTILEKNARLNALVYLCPQNDHPPKRVNGPLSGLKIAVKDNIATRDCPTTCSSAILKEFVSPFDATVVQNLRENGADIIGKANCDEFGMGSLNTYTIHGPVVNPFSFRHSNDIEDHEKRSAGGSSGGSAAAVAAGLCDAALGTDTGGSIRLPASYCGVVGLKPSYGLVSRWGVVSYADSLDCVGVLGKDVAVTEAVFGRISAYDTQDPTSALPETREAASSLCNRRLQEIASSLDSGRFDGLTVGIPQEFFPSELSGAVLSRFRDLLSKLKAKGATLVSVSLPATSYALSAYYVLASAEASSNMARYDGIQYGERKASVTTEDLKKVSNVYANTRTANFGPEVQRRIILGTYALTADAFDNYFLQAQRVRQLVKNDFDRVFRITNVSTSPVEVSGTLLPPTAPDGVDVLLHPSAIGSAPLLVSNQISESALSAYVQDVLTVPASLAGLPALNVPCSGLTNPHGADDWPIGMSVAGQWGTEKLVLAVGKAMESLS